MHGNDIRSTTTYSCYYAYFNGSALSGNGIESTYLDSSINVLLIAADCLCDDYKVSLLTISLSTIHG